MYYCFGTVVASKGTAIISKASHHDSLVIADLNQDACQHTEGLKTKQSIAVMTYIILTYILVNNNFGPKKWSKLPERLCCIL